MDMVLCDTTTFCGCGSQRRSKLEQDPLSQWSLLERPVDAQRTSHITQDRHAAEQEVPRQYHRGKDLHPSLQSLYIWYVDVTSCKGFSCLLFKTTDYSTLLTRALQISREIGMLVHSLFSDASYISLPRVASSIQSIVANKTLTSKPHSFHGRTDQSGL